VDQDLWTKITQYIEIPVWVVLRLRKTEGGHFYHIAGCEKGDHQDLAYELWDTYKQFQDRVQSHMPTAKRFDELEKIAMELSVKSYYHFYLPDYTDDLYVAFVSTTRSYVMANGMIV
jgi:hypothetical protein